MRSTAIGWADWSCGLGGIVRSKRREKSLLCNEGPTSKRKADKNANILILLVSLTANFGKANGSFVRPADLGVGAAKVDRRIANHHSQSARGAQLCPSRRATEDEVACHHVRAATRCRSLKP